MHGLSAGVVMNVQAAGERSPVGMRRVASTAFGLVGQLSPDDPRLYRDRLSCFLVPAGAQSAVPIPMTR